MAGFEVNPIFMWVGQPLNTYNYTSIAAGPGQSKDIWYEWDWGDHSPKNTDENPTHMYLKAGTYSITLTSGTYTDPQCSSTITKIDVVTIDTAGDMIFPNTFRPNASGEQSDVIPIGGNRNYLFYPPVITPTRKYSLQIYTRWGQLIYQTTDPNRGWNGYFRGQLCSEDVYFYRVEGVYETGEPFLKVGDVTLLR